VVDTSGGLLGDAEAALELLGVLLVDESGEIATIIQDDVELLVVLESDELLLEAPLVLLLSLALPRKAGKSQKTTVNLTLTYTGTPLAAIAAAAWSWVE
jgi:hypothetical protein